MTKPPIPVTVLTGFLGAGKTTLLRHLLTQRHGYRCAIIINEFGPVSIDHQLLVGVDEEILELNNGCLCCRVRGDLVKSLAGLFQKQKRFDYVLVETTGLADPGPVAQTFLLPELAKTLRLDAIVTVVDAKLVERELEMAPEASAQIAFADVILLNKSELVSPQDLDRLEARLRRMNSLARLHRSVRSEIDFSNIFNLKARDLSAGLPTQSIAFRASAPSGEKTTRSAQPAGQYPRGDEAVEPHEHHHDDRVKSFAISEERPLDLKRTETWLSELLTNQGADIYRSKGFLNVQGEPKRVAFQGVQMSFEALPDRLWQPGEKRLSQLVFIGRDLDERAIRAGFAACAIT